ncbi:hypothetical protein ACJX0J_018264 [Zea mays]
MEDMSTDIHSNPRFIYLHFSFLSNLVIIINSGKNITYIMFLSGADVDTEHEHNFFSVQENTVAANMSSTSHGYYLIIRWTLNELSCQKPLLKNSAFLYGQPIIFRL